MKKRNQRAAFRCMEQPANEVFRPLAEQQQQAKQLPVVPTADNELATTEAVAKAIKPTETLGSLVAAMHKSHADAVERQFAIVIPGNGDPGRVIELPGDSTLNNARDGAHGGTIELGTITSDDPTKENASHTIAPEDVSASADATALLDEITDAVETESKPSRSGSALIDKLSDIAVKQGKDLMLIVDQTGNGSVKMLYSAVVGPLAGKTGDVTQEAAAVPATAGPLLG